MKLFHAFVESFLEMLDIWFGQGEGTLILIISGAIIFVGFIIAGFVKSRKAKIVFLSVFILLALTCGLAYILGGMMGQMFGAFIFGITAMMFLGTIVRYVMQIIFTKRTIN
jgi:predicted MFS family arabinose efflux permease